MSDASFFAGSFCGALAVILMMFGCSETAELPPPPETGVCTHESGVTEEVTKVYDTDMDGNREELSHLVYLDKNGFERMILPAQSHRWDCVFTEEGEEGPVIEGFKSDPTEEESAPAPVNL